MGTTGSSGSRSPMKRQAVRSGRPEKGVLRRWLLVANGMIASPERGLKTEGESGPDGQLLETYLHWFRLWKPLSPHPHAGPGRLLDAGWNGTTTVGGSRASIVLSSVRPGEKTCDLMLPIVALLLEAYWMLGSNE